MNIKEQIKLATLDEKLDIHVIQQNKDMAEIKGDIDEIKDNHLTHIWEKINDIDKRVAVIAVKITIYVSAVMTIISLAIKYYL